MEIIILGSGTCVPSGDRGSPGLSVLLKKDLLLFDCGSGTMGRLARAGLNYEEIEYLFLSHLHADHSADLVPFLFALKNDPGIRRTSDLNVYGPRGLDDFITGLKWVYGEVISPENYKLNVVEISTPSLHPVREPSVNKQSGTKQFSNGVNNLTGVIKGHKWIVKAGPTLHTHNSLGFRIEEEGGGVICYSGDSGYCMELVELATGCNLAILECSFPDEYDPPGHLTPSLVGRVAVEAKCPRVVLTHLYPPCDRIDIREQCRKYYDGDIIIARDLMRLTVP